MKPRLLITDGEQRAALAVVRSLGRAGYPVYVCSKRAHSLAGASRHVTEAARVTDPLANPEASLGSIGQLVRRWDIDLVVPVTDASLLALLGKEERLHGASLVAAETESYRRISNKRRVTKLAREFGIPVPRQVVIAGPESLRNGPEPVLHFPLVVKPSRSVVGSKERRKIGVRYAEAPSELDRELKQLPREAFPVLLQERIQGPGVGVFLLRWDGEILARFCHRRIREKPPSGGVSVYRMSIPPDPELVEKSERLLAAHAWQGVAMVEYKVQASTGVPFLMEVNGRFWGSLQLAVDAGVDFPRLFVEAFLGDRPQPVLNYQHGARSRWWWGDVDHLLARLTRSRGELELPADAPGKFGALRDFLALWRPGDRSEVFRWRDPRPFTTETRSWIAGAVGRTGA